MYLVTEDGYHLCVLLLLYCVLLNVPIGITCTSGYRRHRTYDPGRAQLPQMVNNRGKEVPPANYLSRYLHTTTPAFRSLLIICST